MLLSGYYFAHSTCISEVSIEQVASLTARNELPIPTLDLEAIAPTASSFTSQSGYRNNSSAAPTPPRPLANPSYSSDDPWQRVSDGIGGNSSLTNGAPSSISGTGLLRDWWKRQERVQVQLIGMHGFILNRYMLYAVASEVSLVLFPPFLGPHVFCSGAHQSLEDIRNSCSFMNALFDDTRSGFYLSCLPNASDVCISLSAQTSTRLTYKLTADESFLEQRR